MAELADREDRSKGKENCMLGKRTVCTKIEKLPENVGIPETTRKARRHGKPLEGAPSSTVVRQQILKLLQSNEDSSKGNRAQKGTSKSL